MADPEAIARDPLITLLRSTMAANKADIMTLYRNDSCLSYQRNRCKGLDAIRAHYSAIAAQQLVFDTANLVVDVQQSYGGCMVIFVSGQFMLNGNSDKRMLFGETFTLAQEQGQWYIRDDIFKVFMA